MLVLLSFCVLCSNSCSRLQLSEVFEAKMNPIMRELGYCCGKKYVFYPNVLVCYGKQSLACTIAQYQVYYAYENRFVCLCVRYGALRSDGLLTRGLN